MIEVIIVHINSRIESLNMFQKIYGLCDIISKGDKSFPAEYCNNEYKQVSEFDKYKGLVYHRRNGNISAEELDEEQTVSCDPFYSITIPLKSVFVIDKKHLKGLGNDAYLEGKIASTIISNISFSNNKQLSILLGADSVSLNVDEIILDRDEIFKSEYSGFDNFFRYEFLYISIQYTITITGGLSCLKQYNC